MRVEDKMFKSRGEFEIVTWVCGQLDKGNLVSWTRFGV